MKTYSLFVACIFLLGGIAQNHAKKTDGIYDMAEYDDTRIKKNSYGIAYILLICSFIFMSGFRYYVGADYGSYYKSTYTWQEVIDSFFKLDEPIIKLITFAIRSVVNDGLAVIFVLALFTITLCFYGFSRYDEGHIMDTLLLYVFLGAFGFSFNGVRQALAVAFIFALFKKEKRLSNIIVILIAFLIHKSALFVLPIMVIAQKRISKSQIGIITISSMLIPRFFGVFYSIMGMSTMDSDALSYATHAINPLRIVVSFAPLFLLVLVKNRSDFLEKYSFLINMTFINALLTLTTANSALLNRMVQYTSIYIALYIPKFKQCMKTERDEMLFMGVILVFYYVYWRYELGNDFIFQFCFNHWGEF